MCHFFYFVNRQIKYFLFYLDEGDFRWTKEDQEVLKNVTVVLAADGEFAFRICDEADRSSLNKSISSFKQTINPS